MTHMQGEEYEPCQFFAKNFQTVCPNAWIEKWNEQREKVESKRLNPATFLYQLVPGNNLSFQNAFPANI